MTVALIALFDLAVLALLVRHGLSVWRRRQQRRRAVAAAASRVADPATDSGDVVQIVITLPRRGAKRLLRVLREELDDSIDVSSDRPGGGERSIRTDTTRDDLVQRLASVLSIARRAGYVIERRQDNKVTMHSEQWGSALVEVIEASDSSSKPRTQGIGA